MSTAALHPMIKSPNPSLSVIQPFLSFPDSRNFTGVNFPFEHGSIVPHIKAIDDSEQDVVAIPKNHLDAIREPLNIGAVQEFLPKSALHKSSDLWHLTSVFREQTLPVCCKADLRGSDLEKESSDEGQSQVIAERNAGESYNWETSIRRIQ